MGGGDYLPLLLCQQQQLCVPHAVGGGFKLHSLHMDWGWGSGYRSGLCSFSQKPPTHFCFSLLPPSPTIPSLPGSLSFQGQGTLECLHDIAWQWVKEIGAEKKPLIHPLTQLCLGIVTANDLAPPLLMNCVLMTLPNMTIYFLSSSLSDMVLSWFE